MRRPSAQPPRAPTARAIRRALARRRAPIALGALLALAAGCRSTPPESPDPTDNELTADKVRELIASGALKPVGSGEGPPLVGAENDLLSSDAPSNELDLAARRIVAEQNAHVTTPAAPVMGDPPAPKQEPSPESSSAAKPPAPADPATPAATSAATPDSVGSAASPVPVAPPNDASARPATGAALAHSLTGDPPENPYLTFGKRILVYENGLIMKPYPLRIGMGERLLGLLKTYGNFPLYTEGVQSTDQVRVELLKDWDQEQVSNLRATDIEETKIQQPFKIADWLVVTARADRLKEVESFINIFAAGVPQIEIEAKIVEVTTTDVLDLGVKQVNDTTPIFGFPDHTFVQDFTFNLPNSASTANAILGLSTVQDGIAFNALLQMLQTYDNVSIISRPKIAVREGGIAKIVNTQKLPSYTVTGITPDGKVAAGLTYEEVGIKLYVVPRVVGTQTVALNIDVEASQQSGTATTFTLGNDQVIANPIISRRAAQTVVYLNPGQAVILGGLVSERNVDTENKVPILGSIPVLGYFFRSTLKRKEQANVLFFIRPRILTGSDLNREF